MATLIPALGSCLRRMQSGERRFAERLESKLEEDYLLWYDVPIGGLGRKPDFVVFHPRRGILVLEVKDYRLDTIHEVTPETFTLNGDGSGTNTRNPYRQACEYAESIASLLQRDPALRNPSGHRFAGKLSFPWGYGVVLTSITRSQFDKAGLGNVMPPDRVICKDEMLETVDPESFQERLWRMFPWTYRGALSLPQIDRIRWHLYPEIRIGTQQDLFANDEPVMPDLLRIMDLQQEQLARSLGDGHRVIHGVAGSGKTMILGYRCLHLARATNKPILVLCYNKTLAARLNEMLRDKGADERIVVRNFHGWCSDQLRTYHVSRPQGAPSSAFYESMVQAVIRGVDRGQIPSGQYGAVLIDEGHDFQAHWLKLVTQMVSAETNSLLVLYDDAQDIYGGKGRGFSFKSVGIQAQGRTTILRLNYRNTAEVLRTAHRFAKDLFLGGERDDDGVQVLEPESANRHGPEPLLVRLPSLSQEAEYITQRLIDLNEEGTPFREMAVVYRAPFVGERIAEALARRGIPCHWLQKPAKASSPQGTEGVRFVTMHSSKGLEFPVVAIPSVGAISQDYNLENELRVTYVGMTRAMDRLLMTYNRTTPLTERLEAAVRPGASAA